MTATVSTNLSSNSKPLKIIITGANSGVGFYSALDLAKSGHTVIMAVRNLNKGKEALAKIQKELPKANLILEELNLGSLKSIHDFAKRLAENTPIIDVLINNAGLLSPIQRKVTEDGFELEFGTNYLGTFALTGLLLPLLNTSASRVVNVASMAHRYGSINFDDLQFEKRKFSSWAGYCQSKLAMLMFTFELDRRCKQHQRNLISCAVHPGWSRTNLALNGPAEGNVNSLINHFSNFLGFLLGQSAEKGALPIVYTAISSEVESGKYYAPSGLFELTGSGKPKFASINKEALDLEKCKHLWEVSEVLTGVQYLDF